MLLRAIALISGVALTCGVAQGCAGDAPSSYRAPICAAPQATDGDTRAFVSGESVFAVALYTRVASAADQNVIVSPYSAASALAMVAAGASGNTATQLRASLNLSGAPTDTAAAYASVACADESDGSSQGNQLSIASAVWVQQGLPLESAFLSVLSAGYEAPLQQTDFAGNPMTAVSAINGWVASQTQSAIPAALSPNDIDASTRLALVNAVYFRGQWDTAFDPASTSLRSFTLASGQQVNVPTMSGTVNLAVGALDETAVYELAYKGRAMVMDFFVPPSLSAFEASLTADMLNAALGGLGASAHAHLMLPKFAFDSHLVLDPSLKAMGITDAFEPAIADFSNVDGERNLFLRTVLQEALVQVDEQGTVAAAATGATESAFADTVPDIAIDQSFMFVIRNSKTGSLLFIGHVQDPRQGP